MRNWWQKLDDPEPCLGDMLVYGLLCRIQARVCECARLTYELQTHPEYNPVPAQIELRREQVETLRARWDALTTDIWKIWQVPLQPFSELARKGQPFVEWWDPSAGPNPLKKTLSVAKKEADKARRKDPTISFLKTTDLTQPYNYHDRCE